MISGILEGALRRAPRSPGRAAWARLEPAGGSCGF